LNLHVDLRSQFMFPFPWEATPCVFLKTLEVKGFF